MSRRHIGAVYKKEILDTVRDRRTLLASIIIPVVLIPAMILGVPLLSSSTEVQLQERIQPIALINGEESPVLLDLIMESDSLVLVDLVGGPSDAIRNGTVSIVIELQTGFDEMISLEKPGNMTIYFDASSRRSTTAYSKIQPILGRFNQIIIDDRLDERNIDNEILRPLDLYALNVATEEEVSGFVLSLILPPILAIMVATGGMNAAIDMTVGEKERHTLEALLVTSTSRKDLVAGKFLAVLTVTLLTSFVMILSLAFWLQGPFGAGFGLGEQSLGMSLQTSVIIFGVLSLIAVMLSGLAMVIATFAKSFKEAQNYVTPLLFIVILGTFASYGISIEDVSTKVFLIPILNVTLVTEEVLLNIYNPAHLITTLGISLLGSIIAIYLASWIFHKESILFRA